MEQGHRLERPAALDERQPDSSPPAIEEPGSGPAFGLADAARIAVVVFAAVSVRFDLLNPLQGVSLLGVLGILTGGWPIFKEAAENLIARKMTMELSMTIAIVAAAAISEFFTALIITLFVLVAEILENTTVARGRRICAAGVMDGDTCVSSFSTRRDGFSSTQAWL